MSTNSEFNVLKVITQSSSKAMEFVHKYDNDLFSADIRPYAKLITDYVKSYRTVPTKRTFFDRYEDNDGSLQIFWDDLERHECDEREFNFDLEKLKDSYKKRAIKGIDHILKEAMSEGVDPSDLIKELMLRVQKAHQVDNGRSHIQKSVGDHVESFQDKYLSRQNLTIESPFIKTGYSMMDQVLGGFNPSELIVIGGETSAGKSQLLNNLATQMWLQGNTIDTDPANFTRGYSVLYFSLEMPYDDCYERFLAKVADIPQRGIRDAKLDSVQAGKMNKALKFIKDYQKAGNHFQIVDVPRNVTIEEMELRYQDALLTFRPDIVVVDYMGLMHDSSKSNEQDWLKLGNIAANLHEFARSYDVVMLTAVQLTDIKRGQKGKDQDESQRVGPHRIGRSSTIMHHVNVGIQIETRPNEKSLPDMRYHIIKNRGGPLAQGNLIKNFECASLYDVPYMDNTTTNEIKANMPELIKKIREGSDG